MAGAALNGWAKHLIVISQTKMTTFCLGGMIPIFLKETIPKIISTFWSDDHHTGSTIHVNGTLRCYWLVNLHVIESVMWLCSPFWIIGEAKTCKAASLQV